ncbi:invasion associated locus B family protein [Falsiroseomonas sp. CW058]|uniref:invasion associated locus B family protein n=1 Tax=Falsiroseomonas sp. CW058 TaxID=3388664 RepID=UPI003D323554
MRVRNGLACLLVAGGLAGPALAQQRGQPAPPAPPPAALPSEAERSTASFGDWTVRCERLPGPPPRRQCEMTQTVQTQGQQGTQPQPVAQWAVGRTAPGEPFRFVVQLPVNLAFATPARVVADGDPAVGLNFARCLPIGCFAEATLGEEALRRLRARNPDQPGRVEFRDAADREMQFPLSFRGFAQALAALNAP